MGAEKRLEGIYWVAAVAEGDTAEEITVVTLKITFVSTAQKMAMVNHYRIFLTMKTL